MDEQLSVYLDHLIPRDNLRYKRSEEFMHYDVPPEPQMLRMYDLFTSQPYLKLLRKPDFQRATWAWSPQECVTLLESITNEQVIPSIIMWSSHDNGYVYVLDGGHRVSVILAWLRDDWGDRLGTDLYRDTKQQEIIKKAAQEVRDLVKVKVGSFREYQEADRIFDHLVDEGKAPKDEMDPKIFARAQFYRRVLKGSVGFHILWVTGNYEKAEQSFLRINRGGKPLSIWETKLIDNRNS